MFLSYLTLAVALTLSTIAAYYSIIGLTAIFAAAVVPIIIMGGILEIAKVTVTVWLHEYWSRCRWVMKLYLMPALVILMLITSMGIFGFLSKAHSDQSLVSGDVLSKISIYDEKIRTAKENIDANRRALKQLDEAVDQIMGRSTTETGAERSVQIRRQQGPERRRLIAEIEAEQKKISAFNEERAPIAAEVRKVEAEVGPIKYIAALIYGDNPDTNLLERSVRWVIILLVIVFDPLAIVMVLAAKESLKWEKETVAEPAAAKIDQPMLEDTAAPPPVEEKSILERYPYLTKGFKYPEGWKFHPPMVYKPEPSVTAPNTPTVDVTVDVPESEPAISPEEKLAMKRWKIDNPKDTLKKQRILLQQGKISQLPWMTDKYLHPDSENPPGQ